jgi:hypothetical protein
MRNHPVNFSYLVVGLVFLGLAGSWALRESGLVDLGGLRWLLPLTLIVAGVVGLVAFAARRNDGGPEEHRDPTYYDVDSGGDPR